MTENPVLDLELATGFLFSELMCLKWIISVVRQYTGHARVGSHWPSSRDKAA